MRLIKGMLEPYLRSGNRCIAVLILFSLPLVTFATNYEEGKQAFVEKDYQRALKIMRPLAESGHSQAQVTMGIMLDNGYGIAKDEAKAFQWYLKAAEQGIPIVQHQVAFKYLHGIGVEKNELEAARWWEMSANSGLADSQFNLGLMHYRGLGISKNYDKAIHYFKLAAEQNHGNAQYSLAVMYAFAQGIEKDYGKAISWFEKAADQNVAQAQFNLGVFYENGYGVKADQKIAQQWYEKAAAQGLNQAREKLTKKPSDDNKSELASDVDSRLATAGEINEPSITNMDNEIIDANIADMSGAEWVFNQPVDSYTLQIASSVNEKDIVRFLKENQLNDKATYVRVIVKGVTRYSAFYGEFKTFDEAENAKNTLPDSLRKAKPWIRNFGILQKMLTESDAQVDNPRG